MTVFPPHKIDLGFGFSRPRPRLRVCQLSNFNDQVSISSGKVIYISEALERERKRQICEHSDAGERPSDLQASWMCCWCEVARKLIQIMILGVQQCWNPQVIWATQSLSHMNFSHKAGLQLRHPSSSSAPMGISTSMWSFSNLNRVDLG